MWKNSPWNSSTCCGLYKEWGISLPLLCTFCWWRLRQWSQGHGKHWKVCLWVRTELQDVSKNWLFSAIWHCYPSPAYTMTLIYSSVERMATSLIFFFNISGSSWATGTILLVYPVLVVGAASRGYDFDLYWEHSGRGKQINATLYIHTEKVFRLTVI